MKAKFFAASAILALPLLTSCQQPGTDLQANVYQAGQVNQVQNAKEITILTVMPAQVEVDNTQNQKTAEVVGGVLGAVGGGLLGGGLTHNSGAGVDSAVLGGVAGAAAGSMVNSKALVAGVTIGYNEAGQILTSTQVGQMCQFKAGAALVVSTQQNETRVQPNAICPPPAKS